MAEWDDENFDYEEEYEEYPRDPAIDAAKVKILEFFSSDRTTVFYLTQLQVNVWKIESDNSKYYAQLSLVSAIQSEH